MGKSHSMPEYWKYKLCQHMGWTYQEFMETPPKFRQECFIFMYQSELPPIKPDPESIYREKAAVPPEERKIEIYKLER